MTVSSLSVLAGRRQQGEQDPTTTPTRTQTQTATETDGEERQERRRTTTKSRGEPERNRQSINNRKQVKMITTMISRICSAIVVVLAMLPTIDASYTISVNPKSEECYHVVTPAWAVNLAGTYDVVDDDMNPDDLKVVLLETRTGHVVWEGPRGRTQGLFLFETEGSEKYSLCFQNRNRAEETGAMQIGFNLRVGSILRNLPEDESGPDSDRVMRVMRTARTLTDEWDLLQDHFDFMRNREGKYEALTLSILSRIQRWSILEMLLVMGIATGQVLYWRKFFETRRYL